MNIKKILTISILLIFALGMIVGAADAAHTFQKGNYKMKVSDKEYNKLKESKPSQMCYIYNKGGTKTVNTVKTKKIKSNTLRFYYNKKRTLVATRDITHHKGYFGNPKVKYKGSDYKTVKHYKSDGSYYEDHITYDYWKFIKKTKKTIWMSAYKHPFNGDNKIYVSTYDFRPYSTKTGIVHKNCGTC